MANPIQFAALSVGFSSSDDQGDKLKTHFSTLSIKNFNNLERNMSYANEAMSHTRNWMPIHVKTLKKSPMDAFHFSNFLNLQSERNTHIALESPHYRNENDMIRSITAFSRKWNIGDCVELCSVAFCYLRDQKNLRKVELLALMHENRFFVVIGRNPLSNVRKPNSWGSAAVVCDFLLNSYYPAEQISQHMHLTATSSIAFSPDDKVGIYAYTVYQIYQKKKSHNLGLRFPKTAHEIAATMLSKDPENPSLLEFIALRSKSKIDPKKEYRVVSRVSLNDSH